VPARIVWRITTARRVRAAFSGEGARLYGGRWNPKGVPLVYTAESRALAMLEMLVQDERTIERVDPAKLPSDRRTQRMDHTRVLGAAWAASKRTVALAVPSAVLPEETNYVLNTAHPDFNRLRVGKPKALVTDVRLMKRWEP
jgi:RES domain-containing protein